MPKKRVKKARRAQKKTQPETTQLIAKNRTAILVGSAVVLLLVAFALNYTMKKNPQGTFPNPTIIPLPTKTASTPIPSSVQKEATSSAKSRVVKKLPMTSGENIEYTIKKGDTLYSIGLTFCNEKSSWTDIAEQNRLTSPYKLYSGNTLTFSCL